MVTLPIEIEDAYVDDIRAALEAMADAIREEMEGQDGN